MMNGASTLEVHARQLATIVTRMLDAADRSSARSIAKFLLLRGSHTCAAGPVHQSAQDGLLGRRVVLGQRRRGGDRRAIWRSVAIKVDRPHSCFLQRHLRNEGHYGLVPYTGVMPIELTIDHTGPMTAT